MPATLGITVLTFKIRASLAVLALVSARKTPTVVYLTQARRAAVTLYDSPGSQCARNLRMP